MVYRMKLQITQGKNEMTASQRCNSIKDVVVSLTSDFGCGGYSFITHPNSRTKYCTTGGLPESKNYTNFTNPDVLLL